MQLESGLDFYKNKHLDFDIMTVNSLAFRSATTLKYQIIDIITEFFSIT